LKDELNSRGITTAYQYGIFSKAQNNYIISNGHFVVSNQLTNEVSNTGDLQLEKSYNVSLFQQDIESPGYLSVYFANRASLVLGSVWKTLIASILFTGIILFCFIYTMSIIFRQKKLSEMKTDFINNMTHEFKTPIATISLAADSITSPIILSNPDKIRRFIDIIREENRRMNSQVERVLQMAMIDKRDFELKVSEMNVHDTIRQAAENFSLQVEQRSGTLTMDFQAEQPVIEGDATHIASIIHNLLDNANKYSPDKPVIQIGTRDVPNGIEITVKDKGIGIGTEAGKHIFDKFYRVHTGNVHDVKGFGLGLSYVKAIMTAHKGLVDVKSELGKGSSFMLTFQHRIGIAREG
jgi:two-component system phosphate regulon sensor histidine kinase PhoR